MKKFSLTSLLIIITIGFSSCSQDDGLSLEDPSTVLFQKMTVGRDASGAYTLDYKLNEGVGSDITDNKDGNGKDIYLYSSDNEARKNVNEEVSLNDNDRIHIGVNNTITNNRSTLTVYDHDIRFNKSDAEDDHLAEYQMTDNGDGTYSLDFTVDPDIEVVFIENEDTGAYEIHLEPGNGDESNFERTFTKSEGEELKIEFINYHSDESAKTVVSTSNKKPVVVIDEQGSDS